MIIIDKQTGKRYTESEFGGLVREFSGKEVGEVRLLYYGEAWRVHAWFTNDGEAMSIETLDPSSFSVIDSDTMGVLDLVKGLTQIRAALSLERCMGHVEEFDNGLATAQQIFHRLIFREFGEDIGKQVFTDYRMTEKEI